MDRGLRNVYDVNLSAGYLTQGQTDLLSKGLYFVPTMHMDLFHILKSVNKFMQELTNKKQFFSNATTDMPTSVCHTKPIDVNQMGNHFFTLQTSFSRTGSD